MLLCVIVLLAMQPTYLDGYRILGLFANSGLSHLHVINPLFHALAEKGHEVTMFSYNPPSQPTKNFKSISLSEHESARAHIIDLSESTSFQPHFVGFRMAERSHLNCERLLTDTRIRNLMKSGETFDLVIVELFNSDCLLAVGYKLGAPMMGISAQSLFTWFSDRFANPDNPSYIPNPLLRFTDEMCFLERIENTWSWLAQNVIYYLISDRGSNEYLRKYVGDGLPPLQDIARNMSVVLVNSHFSLTFPKAQVPGVIDVGGMHVVQPKELPKNIEKWINESTHGVIYFSLGSMIKGHTFPEEKRQAFLRAFGRLPQRVLWKWENDTMPGQPDNVMIQKWMPQLDILCHPNVKAFISHGGLLGTTEAVHCGVPVVVMPQFGDQHTNAKALEKNGGGVILHLHEADEEKVYNALKKVLDPSFNKQAKELSERFRDRPMPPLETAIYWVEYVARHKGAPHMRTAAVGMPLYKYLLLDVIAFLIAVFTVLSWLAYYITKKAIKLVFRSKEKVKTS